MSAIEGFCDVHTELADLNKDAAELTAKMAEVRARFNVPDEMDAPLKTEATP